MWAALISVSPSRSRDGSGHPQYPVVAPGREAHPLEGAFHQGVPGTIQTAEGGDLGGGHLGVAGGVRST